MGASPSPRRAPCCTGPRRIRRPRSRAAARIAYRSCADRRGGGDPTSYAPPAGRSTGHGAPAAFAAACAAASALLCATAFAQPAPPPDRLCPAIDEGYVLCSGDLASGNCGEFVAAAETLAELFQIQAAESPDRVDMLLATNWWGCGSATLIDMKALLGRLDGPRAQALLRADPFQRLPKAEWQAAPPTARPPPGMQVAPNCVNLPTPSAQADCASRYLAAVRAAYQSALKACQAAVAPG